MAAASSSSTEKTWVGTSMEDIYHGHGPWNFDTLPVTASRYHAVLYQLPVSLNSLPKPFRSSQVHHWDDDHVRMPYSPKNLFPVKDKNGEENLKQRWEIIQVSLLQPINSTKELEAIINSYNTKLPKFLALYNFFEEIVEDEGQQFYNTLLPGIIRLALQLPEILPGSVPLLKRGACKSISFTQLQIASLLANAFLCTFPWRKERAATYPGINFVRLFSAHLRPKREQAVAEKLKCICHYFRRVLSSEPTGVVTFERKHFPKSQLPRWDRLENNLGNTRIHVSSTGVIEDDGLGLLQVDFANKNVGGGVLAFGCVQEEIRYVICPELIVSRLFTEQLSLTEALVITGVERYSSYSGYGDSFEWSGDFQDNTPYDNSSRRRTSIVAIDALHFNKPNEQYSPSCILRELNKAYVGFHSRFDGQLPAVATGNWGCGAFRGDPKLKFLIQLMACSAARRDMVYYTFENAELQDSIHEMYLFLATNQITISQLWRYLCRFAQANLKAEHLYSYIHQAHIDSKSQTCIKNFFCFSKKKPDRNNASTSNSEHTHNSNANSDMVDGISSEDNSNIRDDINMTIEDASSEDSECYIIESSQPEEPRYILSKNMQKPNENTANRLSSGSQKKREHVEDDVLRLISLIDGDMVKSKSTTNEKPNVSLLSSIDDCNKRMKDIKKITNEETVEKMDMDEANDNHRTSLYKENAVESHKVNEALSKRKITDYFVKIDKG